MSENKTNAPTIKLPVRYFPPFSEIQDADGDGILRVNGAGQEKRDGIAPFIVAALNEADALRAEVEGLREIISDALELGVFGLQDRSSISAPEDTYIRQLGEQIGFGALMDSASRMWRLVAIEKGLDGSEFTTGPCRSVRENWIAKALAAIKPNAAAGEEKQNAN